MDFMTLAQSLTTFVQTTPLTPVKILVKTFLVSFLHQLVPQSWTKYIMLLKKQTQDAFWPGVGLVLELLLIPLFCDPPFHFSIQLSAGCPLVWGLCCSCSKSSANRVWPRDRAIFSGRRPRESGMARALGSHWYRTSAASVWPKAHAHICRR